jgi:hypothetical protein
MAFLWQCLQEVRGAAVMERTPVHGDRRPRAPAPRKDTNTGRQRTPDRAKANAVLR